jgi:hypothetical protein
MMVFGLKSRTQGTILDVCTTTTFQVGGKDQMDQNGLTNLASNAMNIGSGEQNSFNEIDKGVLK